MNTFEIYTQMFYALNDEWHHNHNEALENYLGLLNPFTRDGNDSSDPSLYFTFKMAYRDYGSDKDYGYYFVKEFLKRLGKSFLINAFNNMEKEDWIGFFEDYLNEEHKGSDIPEHSINNMLKKESEMNSFEMFVLMYYFVDYMTMGRYDDIILDYLGECNPYLFLDNCSADPAVYSDFKKAYEGCEDKGKFGYNVIMSYAEDIEEYYQNDIKPIIKSIKKEDWIYWAIDYLSYPHKGMDIEK
ncbi:hypothetical protein [uncultured Anaerofustis sp.]|uniref:hypothetical protein n=1 Tax=uncultured Anaerofustis sp. TaxID=904996 RepID=UPI0025E55BB3|nr:hypothetical protein [uncultured Anaerofustis sp.]